MSALGLRTRLALVFATGFAVLMGLGALGFYLHLGRSYRRDFDRSVLAAGRGARALFRLDRPEFGTADATVAHLVTELVYGDRTLVAYDSTGRFLAATPQFPDEPYFNDATPEGLGRGLVTRNLREGPARLLRIRLDEGSIVVIAMSTLPLERRLVRLKRSLATVLPLIVVLGGLFGAWGSGLVLRPIVRVAESAERIGQEVARGATRFDRLPEPGAEDEVRTLTAAFNQLIERLSAALELERGVAERQRQFLAEAAHELRTPIAILQSEAEVTLRGDGDVEGYRQAMERIAVESRQLGALVGDLLFIARGDAQPLEPAREKLYLDDIVNRVIGRARAHPAGKDRDVVRGEFEAAPARGDAALLERALLALVHNALVHAPGARVEVSTGTDPARGESWAEVRDFGPGVPAGQAERIFERFARLDTATAGTGLGLAIARAIAAAHGGTLTLEPAQVGARFVLRIPIAPAG